MKNDGQVVIVYHWGLCQVCHKQYVPWQRMAQTKIGIIHINCFDAYYDKLANFEKRRHQMATGHQFPIEGYKEALDLLVEWQRQPNTYKDTTGCCFCVFCHQADMQHKPDCLVSRTRKLLTRPPTLPEMLDNENIFSSPGPPPF